MGGLPRHARDEPGMRRGTAVPGDQLQLVQGEPMLSRCPLCAREVFEPCCTSRCIPCCGRFMLPVNGVAITRPVLPPEAQA